MKEVKKETPKFYMLESFYDNPDTLQTEIIAAYMLKGSYKDKFFRFPVYAIRVPDKHDVECDIYRCEEIEPDILEELEALERR